MSEIELYRPSNGTEGECFMGAWCNHCERDRAGDPERGGEYGDGCPILANAVSLPESDPDYPKEWRQDGPEGPRCTAFVPDGGVIPAGPVPGHPELPFGNEEGARQ